MHATAWMKVPHNARVCAAAAATALPVAACRPTASGREAPGKAFRLYTEDSFAALPATTPPEITRVNLGSVVLQLKALGVADVAGFDFMDPPPKAAIVRWGGQHAGARTWGEL